MAGKIRQLIVYAKVTIAVLLLLSIAVIVIKNWSYKTRFWPGFPESDVPTLWLMLGTAVLSIIAYWLFARTRRAFVELGQIREQRARSQLAAEQKKQRDELRDHEQRIDEKIAKALEDRGAEEE